MLTTWQLAELRTLAALRRRGLTSRRHLTLIGRTPARREPPRRTGAAQPSTERS